MFDKKSLPISKWNQNLLIVTGATSALCGAFGLFLGVVEFLRLIDGEYVRVLQQYEINNFYPIFFAMQAVTIIFCSLLTYCGLDLVRLRLEHSKLFVRLFIFQLVYLPFVGGVLWQIPSINKGVAAASMVTNAMFIPMILLLPLWAPLVIAWTKRQMVRNTHSSNGRLEGSSN